MRRLVRALVFGALLLAPDAAAAAPAVPDTFYRPGMPAVLVPETVTVFARRAAIIEEFASRYRARGRPGLAVFWNRRFDDRLSDWTSGLRVSETGREDLDLTFDGRLQADQERVVTGRLGARLDQRRTVAAAWRRPVTARPGLPEALAFSFESGFTATLAEAGAHVLDRAAIMRLQDRAARSADPDGQRIETDALLARAELLLEVLASPQGGTPLGLVFQVNVKEVPTGRVHASLTSDAQAAADAAGEGWQVGPRGFVRAPAGAATARRAGEELALETMAALALLWR